MNPIIIVGSGPVGMRCAQEILSKHPALTVQVYGEEAVPPYNRVRLSGFLNRDYDLESIELPEPTSYSDRFSLYSASRVVGINREAQTISSTRDGEQRYQALVLALGSRAVTPELPGSHMRGVYTFRDLKDAIALQARQASSRHVVVIGGGLLGLEAAKAMLNYGTRVTVVEHNAHLMFQQLDGQAGELLKQHMESLNIRVLTSSSVKLISGDMKVEGIELRNQLGGEIGSQQILECDTVIMATGIRSNIDLARKAGLSVGRGITVNDQLQTSDDSIYAIGDCAEHNDVVYGLVSPGFEQAAVAAANIINEPARYTGSIASTSLKVAGCSVFSMGDINPMRGSQGGLIYTDESSPVYRRLNLQHRRLTGGIAIGEWSNKARLQEAIQQKRSIFAWQQLRFKDSGDLWSSKVQESVALWPSCSIVCSCTGVTRGELSQVISAGAATVSAVCSQTGASGVCGSCKPNIANLLGSAEPVDPLPFWKPITFAAVVSAVVAVLYLFWSGLPYQNTVMAQVPWDSLWRDSFARKVSGFSLLGGALLVTLISFRKRLTQFSWLQFSIWRLLHVLIGALLLVVLLVHSGARMGDNLNFWLMLSFLGVIASGGLLGAVLGSEHRLSLSVSTSFRSWSLWLHLLFLWPLPVLLSFHILKAFYFK